MSEFGAEHFTVHEADFALFHAWRDGMPVRGPLGRHEACGLISKFRTGLKMSRAAQPADSGGFGEWRAHGRAGGTQALWTVETSVALAAIHEDGVQLSTVLPPDSPLILMVRFLSEDTGRWRMFQFHDCVFDPVDVADASENMMQSVIFRAGWREELTGANGGTLPPMVPRLVGVIEWRHLGRWIPCHYFDAVANTWAENPENLRTENEESCRYVTMAEEDDGWKISYWAARTMEAPEMIAGLPAVGIGWLDARALQILDTGAAGLVLEPGWQLQEGAAEPIALHPSGLHWDHPQVVFRFLGRIFATLSHGLFCVPSVRRGVVQPFDFPIRIGRMVLQPDGAWVLPE